MLQIKALGLPVPIRQYRFAWATHRRKWALDMCWPDRMLGLEVDGAIWTAGRHTRGAGATSDAEKYSHAALLGFRVMRFTTAQVRDGTAIRMLEQEFSK